MVKRKSKTLKLQNPPAKSQTQTSVSPTTSSGSPHQTRCSPPTRIPGPFPEPHFPPLQLSIQHPDTAILLLGSEERPVLLSAAAALAEYSSRARETLDLRLVDGVLGLIGHSDLFVRRFSLKLLALMAAVPSVRAHLLQEPTCMARFIETIQVEEDDFLKEFAARILAEMTADPEGAVMFLRECRDTGVLFEMMGHRDPDIKKNSVEIVGNLLKDLEGFDAIFSTKAFSFERIYELFKEPYPIIQQLALSVIELLVMHSANEAVQEIFRFSGGPQYLLNILDNNEWNDLHDKVLRILSLSCDNSKTAELMNNTDGTKRLFAFMQNAEDDKLKLEVLNILVRLAEGASGKKVLHALGFVKFLLDLTETIKKTETQALIAKGISKMTQYVPAAGEISAGNPVSCILQLLNNDQAKWSERQAAISALKELFLSDFQNCINFLDYGGLIHLIHIVNQPAATVPWEIQVTCVQALSALADYSALIEDLIEFDLFAALCLHLDSDTNAADELKITCCEVLAQFAVSAEARQVLVRLSLPCKLYGLLIKTQLPIPVLNAVVHLMLVLCADSDFAKLCAHEGCLFFMLKNRSAQRAITSWKPCVEALFSADLSMKFAYTGRLSLRDLTPDGFHAMRHSCCPFPILDELFRLKLCPLQPIYVANFSETVQDQEDDYLSRKCLAFNAARAAIRRQSSERGIRVSEATINAWLELKFGRLQPDPGLQACFERFKAELVNAEQNGNPLSSTTPGLVYTSKIESRARLLGSFVARWLSGPDPSKDRGCLEEQLELHLKMIRERLETNLIPLGLLRIGSYLERALLFKVIADRIGLPAALVRGCRGKSWIEIAVPTLRVADNLCEGSSGCQLHHRPDDALPSCYLRANFIVDLTDEPGELIAFGSCRARSYREQRLVCEFACCAGKAEFTAAARSR